MGSTHPHVPSHSTLLVIHPFHKYDNFFSQENSFKPTPAHLFYFEVPRKPKKMGICWWHWSKCTHGLRAMLQLERIQVLGRGNRGWSEKSWKVIETCSSEGERHFGEIWRAGLGWGNMQMPAAHAHSLSLSLLDLGFLWGHGCPHKEPIKCFQYMRFVLYGRRNKVGCFWFSLAYGGPSLEYFSKIFHAKGYYMYTHTHTHTKAWTMTFLFGDVGTAVEVFLFLLFFHLHSLLVEFAFKWKSSCLERPTNKQLRLRN